MFVDAGWVVVVAFAVACGATRELRQWSTEPELTLTINDLHPRVEKKFSWDIKARVDRDTVDLGAEHSGWQQVG